MTMGRKYRRPPVVEALCELHFAGSEWDDTVPGRFFESVKDEFPVKRQREIQEAQIKIADGQAEAGVKRLTPWIQFVSQQGDRMLQLARDLLVVNQLRPYPSFEDWQPSIERALRIYGDLARPQGVARLGVRYINHVVIPGARVQLEHYFTVHPQLPKGLGDEHGVFMVRFEIPAIGDGHSVVVTFASAVTDKRDAQAFLLDIYDRFEPGEAAGLDSVAGEVTKAHSNVEAAFEGSITEELRKLLEPENER